MIHLEVLDQNAGRTRLLLDPDAGSLEYIDSLNPAPHISDAWPAQAIEQSFSGAVTAGEE
jgi:hypothetical protein